MAVLVEADERVATKSDIALLRAEIIKAIVWMQLASVVGTVTILTSILALLKFIA